MNGRDFFSNLIKFCVPSVVSAVVAICVLPLISRVYPEAEYGYISNFYSVGNLMMGIVLLGLDNAYIRFFYEPPKGCNRNGLFIYALRIGVVCTFVVYVLISILASNFFAELFFGTKNPVGLYMLGIYTLSLVLYRLLNISMRFSGNAKGYNCQQILFIVGNRLLFVTAVLWSTRYVYSVLIMLVTTVIIDVICVLYQKKIFESPKITIDTKREMLRYAIPTMPTGILVFLNNSISKLILGSFGLRSDVGVLAVATTIANVFSVIPSAFTVFWGTYLYKYYAEEKRKIAYVHDIIVCLSVFLVLSIGLLQNLAYNFLGEGYRGSQSYFMIIMLTPITSLLSETTGCGIALAKKTKYILYLSVLGCIINIIICYCFIPILGAMGAALGIGFSATICFVVRTLIAQHYYDCIESKKRTVIGCAFLWIVCAGNLFIYNKTSTRLLIYVVLFFVTIVLYRNVLIKAWKSLKNSK